jgi:hypothetical protein
MTAQEGTLGLGARRRGGPLLAVRATREPRAPPPRKGAARPLP